MIYVYRYTDVHDARLCTYGTAPLHTFFVCPPGGDLCDTRFSRTTSRSHSINSSGPTVDDLLMFGDRLDDLDRDLSP